MKDMTGGIAGEKHAAMHASARKRIQPVKHTLKIEPVR